jgi:hypothetical protein
MSSWWRKLCIGSFGKVPEPKSYEQVSLVKLTLPWLRFKWGPTINVWGGVYGAGKTKRSGDRDREGHIRVNLNIEWQQFSQPTKEMTNTRPRGLRIWYNLFRALHTMEIIFWLDGPYSIITLTREWIEKKEKKEWIEQLGWGSSVKKTIFSNKFVYCIQAYYLWAEERVATTIYHRLVKGSLTQDFQF